MSKMTKDIILLLVSSLSSILIFGGIYESYKNWEYEQWKSCFQKEVDWHGLLTVPSRNKVLMWEYRNNSEYHDPIYHNVIKTNEYGFRDQYHEPLRKQENVTRIAFIGDSVVFGINVNYENTFVRKFEIYSNECATGQGIEALNFGVDGYNTLQITELLKTRILFFKPDRVVYMLNMNDFDFEDASGKKIRYFKKPKSFLLELLDNSYNRVYRKIYYGKDYYSYFHYQHFKKNKQIVFQEILKMRGLLREKDIDFQVVLLPIFHPDMNDFRNYPLADMHREIIDFLIGNRIETHDVLESFQKLRKPPHAYAYDIWHPNELGHDLIAQNLLQAIPTVRVSGKN